MSLLARISAAALARHQRNVPWPTGSGAITTRAKAATMASKAPSSPVGATEGAARPIPPEALNGLTGAAYTDVIRREADRDYFTECIAARDATIAQMADEIKEAWLWISAQEDTIEHYKADITEALATIARMRTGRP